MLKLSDKELVQFLDSRIRCAARSWVTAKSISQLIGLDENAIQKLASLVFDSIISDFQWKDQLLEATRVVKFNRDYVAKVIRNGLTDGSIALNESRIAELDNLTEGIAFSKDIEDRIQRISMLVAKDTLKK